MKGNSWGRCPYRYFGWIEEKGVCGGLGYICGKRNVPCDPDYCLGPDEDLYRSTNLGPIFFDEFITEEKGDEDEHKAV